MIENQYYLASNVTPIETKINRDQTDENKPTRTKRPRKRTQLKQRSAIDDLSHIEEQIDDTSEDEENTEIY